MRSQDAFLALLRQNASISLSKDTGKNNLIIHYTNTACTLREIIQKMIYMYPENTREKTRIGLSEQANL